MTTVTQVTHKAKLIHKEDQIFMYRDALFAKNKEAVTPVEAWVVNVNGVEHKARTKKMAKEIIDLIVDANTEEQEFTLAPVAVEPAPKKLTKAEVKANILREQAVEVEQEVFTIDQVRVAYKAVNTVACWYDKPEYYKPINFAVKQGWMTRLSTTQVHWTDEGAGAYKAHQESKEAIVPATADADVLLALQSHKFGLKANQPNYEKTPMESNLETLLPAIEMWARGASTTHKTGKVRVYMSKQLFNKDVYRKQIRTLKEAMKEKYGVEIVVSMYDVNAYMTLADNRVEGHEFVLAFHYLNGWIGKNDNESTTALLKDYE